MSSRANEMVADRETRDNHQTVTIDRSIAAERWRFTCPKGHTDWYPTNQHVWCKGCRRAIEAGHELDAEYHAILDQRTGETIPWDAVEMVERDRHQRA